MNRARVFKKDIFLLFLVLASLSAEAQTLLNKKISFRADKQPVSAVLSSIGRQNGFYFSYNSSLISEDSLVTFHVSDKTVTQVLDILFAGRLRYKETRNYVIFQPVFPGQAYTVSGYITDGKTGEKISDASIYEPHQFVSAFSDDQGFFRLSLKNRYGAATIHISRVSYLDTGIIVNPGYDQELNVVIRSAPFELDPIVVYNKVEKTWLAKVFLSSRQRIQSLNISKFFADEPFQFSLTPGLGTRGAMSAQVINKFSLNLLGGYTAGINGVEIGGLFNIVKKDVSKVQAAGLFNVVGGKVKGVQLAGLHNKVLDSVLGLQVAGFNNQVNGPVTGVQLGGIYNQVNNRVSGVQVGGMVNTVRDKMEGLQIAGFYNIGRGEVNGAQIAGLYNRSKSGVNGVQIAGLFNIGRGETNGLQVSSLFNYTKKLTGVQLSLINIADTSEGYGIGLINLSGNYHTLSVSADELTPVNLAFRSGNKKLYSILEAGYKPDNANKLFRFGFGFGRQMDLTGKWAFNTEMRWLYVYTGSWKDLNHMIQASLDARFRFNKHFSVFAGPSFSAYTAHQDDPIRGYQYPVPSAHYHRFDLWNRTAGWVGWHVGVSLF